MMAKNPIETGVNTGIDEKAMLRLAIIAELDATSLYKQMAANTKDSRLKTIFLDVAKEEKTHVGEVTALLEILDLEQKAETENGKKEVEDKI